VKLNLLLKQHFIAVQLEENHLVNIGLSTGMVTAGKKIFMLPNMDALAQEHLTLLIFLQQKLESV